MDPQTTPFDSSIRHTLNLFRRCVECSTDTPGCPTCAPGEICTQVSSTCDQCGYNICMKVAASGATNNNSGASASNGPNVGAIAGGVIGGIALIAIIVFLVWRFYFKGRRSDEDDYEFDQTQPYGSEKERRDSATRRAARASTHTVASIANSVRTTASNVIQIAFIPGITSRRDVDEVPPVPALPPQHQSNQPDSPYSEQPPHNSYYSDFRRPESSHSGTPGWRTPYTDSPTDHYFMPRDLRLSSAFSETTVDSDRRSSVATSHFTRQSITPSLARGSIASTIYGHEVEPMPARTAQRGRANVVSVHNVGSSHGTTPTSANVPDVPTIDYGKYGAQPSVPSTPTEPLLNMQPASAGASEKESLQVPGASSKADLSVAIQEAARKASRQPTHGGLGSISKREASPFSDEHAVHDE